MDYFMISITKNLGVAAIKNVNNFDSMKIPYLLSLSYVQRYVSYLEMLVTITSFTLDSMICSKLIPGLRIFIREWNDIPEI